jgi:hypothetical protein
LNSRSFIQISSEITTDWSHDDQSLSSPAPPATIISVVHPSSPKHIGLQHYSTPSHLSDLHSPTTPSIVHPPAADQL